MSYTKTVWEDLPSTNTPLNATNLNNIEDGIEDADLRIEDIDDRVTDNEQDIIQINNMLDMFNDTSGSDWKAMMKNKIDYCINNINTTKINAQAFVNGGWSGVNFGFGLFSKIGNTYQLEWFSKDYSYYCRKLSNGTYEYSTTGHEQKELYNNTSGTTGNVTLSETSANFTYLEVFYCHSITKAFSSTKIYAPNGKSVALQVGFQGSSGTNTQFGSAVYSISGTSMTKGESYGHGQINNGGNGGASKDARVLITRVIGYR